MFAEAALSDRQIQLPVANFIFGSTLAMQEVRKTLEVALHDDLPMLIEGECGTGKEILARYLHLRSRRAAGPFVRVNCGAKPARLLDGEMFGTGTSELGDTRAASGSVELAADGTLFLDEIGEMDSALQRKVVRTLKAGVRGKEGHLLNARIVCASSVDLEADIRGEGTSPGLSSGFAYRVRLLPLRERKQDIPQLCQYLIDKFAREFRRTAPRLKPDVMESFQRWNWPGNIRELENWMARIVIFGTEEALGVDFTREMGERQVTSAARRHGLRLNLSRMRRARRHG